jgi:hypothetical protein
MVAGREIAGIRLGEAQSEIPSRFQRHKIERGLSNRALNLEWSLWYSGPPLDPEWSLGIKFSGNYLDRHNRVSWLELRGKRVRAANGVGMGSTLAQVKHAYPQARCYATLPGQELPGVPSVGEPPATAPQNPNVPNDDPPGCIVISRLAGRRVYTFFYEIDPNGRVDFITMADANWFSQFPIP